MAAADSIIDNNISDEGQMVFAPMHPLLDDQTAPNQPRRRGDAQPLQCK